MAYLKSRAADAGYSVPTERERGSKRGRPCPTCEAAPFRSCVVTRVSRAVDQYGRDAGLYTVTRLRKGYHPNR